MVTRIKASNIESGAVTTDKFAAGAVTAEKIDAGAAAGPRISSIDYPGDDTAALPAGGQTVIINGSGFVSGCSVFLNETVVTTVGFVSATQLQITAPARSTGTYLLYVVNPDGGTAISVPGMVYSGTPTWTTASGSLGTPYETAAVSINLAATGDGSLTYAVTSGSSLPAGISLTSGGLLSGTVPATAADTTYNFELDVIDSENQSTTRQFSITYKVDVVTWSSPNAGASFTWVTNQANSTSLIATSAAGKSVSFSVQSGSLPTGVSVSGSNIAGTPTAVQANTSVVIRATAADTARYADRTVYFTTQVGTDYLIKLYGSTTDGGSSFVDSSSYGHTVVNSDGQIYGDSTYKKNGSTGIRVFTYQSLTPASNLKIDISSRNLNFTNDSWLMGFWVYQISTGSEPYGALVGFYDSSDRLLLGIDGGSTNTPMRWRLANGTIQNTGLMYNEGDPNGWKFYQLTHTAGQQIFYINSYNDFRSLMASGSWNWGSWVGVSHLEFPYANNNIAYIKINYLNGGFPDGQGNLNSASRFAMDSFYLIKGSTTHPPIPTSEPF